MTRHGIDIPADSIADYCRRHRVRRLALFGSILRDDFRPGSDIDVLVTFEPGSPVGLFKLTRMELELSELLGQKVDLNTPGFLSPYFRDEVLREAVALYDAA